MSPKKKTKAPHGQLVPQPNGRGALARGGPNPPSALMRDRSARYFDEHIETLARIAAGEEGEEFVDKEGNLISVKAKLSDRINAIKALGTFGIGVKVESTVDERRLLVVKVVYEDRPVAE